MVHSSVRRSGLLLAAGVLLVQAAVRAQEVPSGYTLEARVESASARPGEAFVATLTLRIPPDHLVHADAVEIAIAEGSAGRILEIEKPPPLEHVDPFSGETVFEYEASAAFRLRIRVPADATGTFETRVGLTYAGCSGSFCALPETLTAELSVPVEGPPAGGAGEEAGEPAGKEKPAEPEAPAAAEPEAAPAEDLADRGFLLALLAALGAGLMLSLSPCVYPLIPVTAAVVAATGGDRNWKKGLSHTLVYVLGLSLTYAGLGALVAALGGTFGAVSGHWAVLAAIGVLFLVLSWNLFGVFELELPAGLRSRLAAKRAGGVVGLLSMGALSGLAVSPCIAAPIAAVLTYISTTGDVLFGAALLFVIAWGMSALLILAGTFPGLAQKLPRAGSWMLAVKTGLGVVLVVASVYFLKTVLPAWLFTPWLALPLVALGLWRGVRKTDLAAPRAKRALRAAGITALVLGLYFGTGAALRGADVPVLSALYPREIMGAPSKLHFREDLETALEEAKADRKPAMIFFTGKTCAGCRELERTVLSRDDVASEAKRFVVLKADVGRRDLPEGFLKRFGVRGAPTVVWLDGDGEVQDDLTLVGSDISPEGFLARMRKVR